MNTPKVHIIIINFGTPDDTIECLQSIVENEYPNFQVVIVDVLNKKNSVPVIRQWISNQDSSKFHLIEAGENKGFSYANNLAIKYVLNQKESDFIWVLNNDTVIDKRSITNQVDFYKIASKKENVGFIGSKTLDYQQRDMIQTVGGVFNKWTKFPDWVGSGEKDTGQYDDADIRVDHIQGSSMFFHSSLLKSVGLMPEDYFLYFEDTDWCVKAQRAGFVNKVCTSAVVYHKQGTSTGVKYIEDEKALKNKRYFYKNLLKFYKLYYKRYLPAAYFFLIKKWAGRLARGNYKEAKEIINVILNK